MRAGLAILGLLAATVLGCGDGVIIIAVNTGTVSDPFCGSGTGHFDLQSQGGLVLLVVINSDTTIIAANGGVGRCTDLTPGAHVQVRGPQQGAQITAQSVRVQ